MKGLGNSIKHPLFKYAMYTLAAINLYGYTTKKKFNCLLSFVVAVMVTHYFIIKNIPFALMAGLIISSFVLGCGNILEGAHTNSCPGWDCDVLNKTCGNVNNPKYMCRPTFSVNSYGVPTYKLGWKEHTNSCPGWDCDDEGKTCQGTIHKPKYRCIQNKWKAWHINSCPGWDCNTVGQTCQGTLDKPKYRCSRNKKWEFSHLTSCPGYNCSLEGQTCGANETPEEIIYRCDGSKWQLTPEGTRTREANRKGMRQDSCLYIDTAGQFKEKDLGGTWRAEEAREEIKNLDGTSSPIQCWGGGLDDNRFWWSEEEERYDENDSQWHTVNIKTKRIKPGATCGGTSVASDTYKCVDKWEEGIGFWWHRGYWKKI